MHEPSQLIHGQINHKLEHTQRRSYKVFLRSSTDAFKTCVYSFSKTIWDKRGLNLCQESKVCSKLSLLKAYTGTESSTLTKLFTIQLRNNAYGDKADSALLPISTNRAVDPRGKLSTSPEVALQEFPG